MLEKLRTLNPDIPFYSVNDPEFRPFGRVLSFPADGLITACERNAPMLESGSKYVQDMPGVEEKDFAAVQHSLLGESPCQIGCCWGYSNRLNCLEYHRSSEVNVAVSDLVLLLARQQDLDGFELDTRKVTAFFVPKGTVIEVYATTLHFCPCQVSDGGFRCIVILPKGVNYPLTQPRPEGGDGRLLWAQGKWLIAHEENESVVSRGGYPGLHGVNYQIHY